MPTNAQLKAEVQADIRDKTLPRSILKANVADALDAGYDYTDQEVGYRTFFATLTQTGTSNPTVTEIKNTLGYTPTIGYAALGTTGIILTGLDATKVQVILSPKTSASKTLIPTYSISGNTISLKTYNLANNAFENDMLVDTPLLIMVRD